MQYSGFFVLAFGLIGLAAFKKSEPGEVVGIMAKRGIRNNNPGNLVKTSIQWRGKVPESESTDSRFEQFTSPVWGIRAMFMDIRGDIEKDGKNTLVSLLSEYAPSFENNTASYVQSVAQRAGLGPEQPITPEYYEGLIKAIIYHENGEQPYSDATIQEAMALA